MRDIQPIAGNSALTMRELLSLCVSCGKCLGVCPTYSAFPLEMFSPRGRLKLAEAILERKASPSYALEAIASCLLCGRCESACDLEIPITNLLAHIRHTTSVTRIPDSAESAARIIFGSPSAQRGIFKTISRIKRFLPKDYRGGLIFRMLGLDSRISAMLNELKKAPFTRLHGRKRGAKAALFVGCSTNYFFHNIGISALSLFDKMKTAIDVPDPQACCGLVLWAIGDKKGVKSLAELNLETFEGYEEIIFLCRSCSYAFRKLYPELLGEGGRHLAACTRDVTEVLAGSAVELEYWDSADSEVEFHVSCHAEISQKEREFFAGLGVRIDNKGCCGGGGSFGFRYPSLSHAIANKRARRFESPSVITDCMGCYIQLKYLRLEKTVEVKSACEWLRERIKTT